MAKDKWGQANQKAKEKYGVSLNDLVKKRTGLKKDSAEYAVIQNAINDSLGSSKVRTPKVSEAMVASHTMGLKNKAAKVGGQIKAERNKNQKTAESKMFLSEQRVASSGRKAHAELAKITSGFGLIPEYSQPKKQTNTAIGTARPKKKFKPST
jgi:hypothetical protein